MKTCLVVDDSRVIRKVARKILEDLSFSIEEAEDGQQALDACGKAMPDVVLLDWNMPIMDGIEFLKNLRKSPGGSDPVVLFCTTKSEVTDIQEAIVEGADEYIMKPFDSDLIQDKLKQAGVL
jgi:two-component system chemotaxis response regulator CheY